MNIRQFKLFVLLLGFLTGNLFGTLLNYLRQFFVWDGLIIATLIILNEIISYTAYKPLTFSLKNRFLEEKPNTQKGYFFATPVRAPMGQLRGKKNKSKICKQSNKLKEKTENIAKYKKNFFLQDKAFQKAERHTPVKSFFNFFKIGVLVGFFIDAFKVGS